MTPATQTSFSFFTSFLLEIQSLILEACPPDDQICLHLASKTLYTLSITNRAKPSLLYNEPPLCYSGHMERFPGSCHMLALKARKGDEYVNSLIENFPGGRLSTSRDIFYGIGRRCKTESHSSCCRCFSPVLWPRLRAFIRGSILGSNKSVKDLIFCKQCEKFTWRKKAYGLRCFHGRAKPRKRGNNNWTNKKAQSAYGYNWRESGFINKAVESMESRLRHGRTDRGRVRQKQWWREGTLAAEEGTKRYELRDLKGREREARGLFKYSGEEPEWRKLMESGKESRNSLPYMVAVPSLEQ